jgi:hypothetical protein
MTVILGGNNTATTPTQISISSGPVLFLSAGAGGGAALYCVSRLESGVEAYSYGADGVWGKTVPGSRGFGVHGTSAQTAGVFGDSPLFGTGVLGSSPAGVGVEGQGVDGVRGFALTPGGIGVLGSNASTVGRGVFGFASTGVGVEGYVLSGTGVEGNGSAGVVGRSAVEYGIGVYGETTGGESIGVFGQAATVEGGIGVYAVAPTRESTALRVEGSAEFSECGEVTIAAGAAQATISGVRLRNDTFILATLQKNTPGVFVRAAVPDVATNSVTIYLNQAAPANTLAAWFAVCS